MEQAENVLDDLERESEELDGDYWDPQEDDADDIYNQIVPIDEDLEENEEQIIVEPDHPLSPPSYNNTDNEEDSADYQEPILVIPPTDIKKTLYCEVCNKMFSKRSNYTRHIKIHLGLRSFPCSSCDKSFCSRQNLDIHNRVHTGERPYVCVLCAKAFAVQQNLSIHLRSHTGVKPYPCASCDKSFNSKQKLTIHIRTHTGEKPYSCEECSRAFAQREHLVKHYRMHTGERPYGCNMCDKAFASSSHLTRHKKQVHINHPNYADKLKNSRNSQENTSIASVILNKFTTNCDSAKSAAINSLPTQPVQITPSSAQQSSYQKKQKEPGFDVKLEELDDIDA